MVGRFQLVDGTKRVYARIDDEGRIQVLSSTGVSREPQNVIPFRSYLTTAAGSEEMAVDGGTTPVEFSIEADTERDIFVSMLSFMIVDASSTLSKFGNLTALTNGIKLWFSRDPIGEIVIADELKSNWDLVRLCSGIPSFGSGGDAFRGSNVVGNSEAYIPMLDLKSFMPPYGLQVRAATTQRVVITVQDDISGLDNMNVIAYGFQVIPEDSPEYLPNV